MPLESTNPTSPKSTRMYRAPVSTAASSVALKYGTVSRSMSPCGSITCVVASSGPSVIHKSMRVLSDADAGTVRRRRAPCASFRESTFGLPQGAGNAIAYRQRGGSDHGPEQRLLTLGSAVSDLERPDGLGARWRAPLDLQGDCGPRGWRVRCSDGATAYASAAAECPACTS